MNPLPKKKIPANLGTLIGLVLFVVALVALQHQLRHYKYRDVIQHLRQLPAWRYLAAFAFTGLGYLCLSGYDFLALLYVKRPLPYRRIALASYIGYAFSNNLGSAVISGGSVRFRLYTAWGLSALEVTKVVLFGIATFWAGFFVLAGAALLIEPQALGASLNMAGATARLLGAGCLAVVALYVLAGLLIRRPVRIRDWQMSFPPAWLCLAQIGLAVCELLVTSGILYNLLPRADGLTYGVFLGVYVVSLTVGIMSQVPGGLGVFETLMVTSLSDKLPADAVIGSLLAYRAIYYVLPLATAAALFGAYEIRQRREEVGQIFRALSEWAPALVPNLLAFLSFVGGGVLLFSGAVPSHEARLNSLHSLVPLPVIEISHFMGSVLGVGMLILARSLQRRLDAAYTLTATMLAGGIVFSLLKGLEYEEALILALLLAALLPCRREFYRKAALSSERFTPGWTAAILFALFAFLWLGMFSHKNTAYSNELWWQFALMGRAPRFMRAAAGALGVALFYSVRWLLRPAPPEPPAPEPADLERALPIIQSASRASAQLALLGDKSLLFGEDGKALLMYGIEGNTWVALGDPVGPEEEIPELIWHFREICDRKAGRCVFYQVDTSHLPVYLDLGLTLMKLGENARVPLADFSLEGAARKNLRHAANKLRREGFEFEVAPAGEAASLMPELKAVSDAWLESKNAREKGFSLGFFEERYLSHFPIAIVRREGRVAAFANLWLSGGKREASIDLMRHSGDAPSGVMDFLFAELMLWAKSQGYEWFDLGMAPLSGIEDRELAPLKAKLGAAIYRHGEHFYNFQGLREYKDKFEPVWEPRYLVSPGGLALPRVLIDIAALISGGIRGVFKK